MMSERERSDRLSALMKDEDFTKGLLEQNTPEEVQAYFEKHGLEFTVDEVKSIGQIAGDTIRKVRDGELDPEQVMKAANGELTEDELEEVAGGFIVTFSIVGCAYAVSVWGLVGVGVTSAAVVGGTAAVIDNWDSVCDFFASW